MMNPIIQVAGGEEKKRKELTDTAAVGNGGCVLNASNDWQFSHDWAVRLRALHLFTRAIVGLASGFIQSDSHLQTHQNGIGKIFKRGQG